VTRIADVRRFPGSRKYPHFHPAALERALAEAGIGYTPMCAEGVWWRCHRSMIADFFKAHGWEVLHILGPAVPQEHPYAPVARIVDGELTY
jgi:uncharacterized protein (DUF488 family)